MTMTKHAVSKTRRKPNVLMDEIPALDAESAEVLQTIRGLL